MQALVASEPSPPAEEAERSLERVLLPARRARQARDTPRSGASGVSLLERAFAMNKPSFGAETWSGHTSAGTSELDLATDCRALQSGFPIKQQQQVQRSECGGRSWQLLF